MSSSFGVLLHISSIPTLEPIGNIGVDAIEYLDFLSSCKARYWQILPLKPVDQFHSPYASPSAFAGEIRYIDIKSLDDQDLVASFNKVAKNHSQKTAVDYESSLELKLEFLKEYYNKNKISISKELEDFHRENPWLQDYSLFQSLKNHFDGVPWNKWPEGIRMRMPSDLESYSDLLQEDIRFNSFAQYLFFQQWKTLKSEAQKRNISIIGDIPMYVPFDSVEVWCNPHLFCLDENLDPIWISGAPPDYFNPEGQRWDTPVYAWSKHKENDFAWWRKRISHAFRCCDIIRLDHFRGFESFWAVPPHETDARGGKWIKGPGMDLLSLLQEDFFHRQFIVEDLGNITPEVEQMKKDFGYPGMRVFQFAFDGNPQNPHLPENATKDDVYYSGTHDNPPIPYWYETLDEKTRTLVHSSLGPLNNPVTDMVLEKVLQADAAFSMIQFQDLLQGDPDARMNTPGTIENNWTYKVPLDIDLETLAAKIRSYKKQGLID